MVTHNIDQPRVADILRRFQNQEEGASTDELLDELLEIYASSEDEETAKAVRYAFLLMLIDNSNILDEEAYCNFLADEVQAEDFGKLTWQEPTDMISFCEKLYGFRFTNDRVMKRVRVYVQRMLVHALRRYEDKGDMEQLFILLRMAPTSPMMSDVELMRLRHRAYIYEMKRTRRNRRTLYGYLIVQAILVVLVFPFLFINAENGEIQRQVEAAADISLGDPGYRLITYSEGLYWAIITAASIGYGDITPLTTTGRMIAAILGTMGVVTVGVMAGLILDWITPRQID